MVEAGQDVRLSNISLAVRAGEIVGIAGVQGNGQTELVEAITGLTGLNGGSVRFLNSEITSSSVRARHAMGIAHIPEDRQKSGMVASFTVAENMVLNSIMTTRGTGCPD